MLLETLPEIPIFKGLDREQIEELNSWLRRVEFPAGQVIFAESAPPDGLYILAKGKVTAVKRSATNPFQVVELQGPTVFGEMGLLTGERRSAAIHTLTPVVTGHLPIDLFEAKIAAKNTTAFLIALNLGRIASQRLRAAVEMILLLAEACPKDRAEREDIERVYQRIGEFCQRVLQEGVSA